MAKVLKYVRARMDLLNFIAREGFVPGDRLPREKDLVSAFNMSSISLRRAMEELAEQGVIEKIQGLGTFLRKPVTQMAMQGKLVLLDIQESKPYSIPPMARELQLLLELRRMDFEFIPAMSPGNHLDRLIADATGVFVIGRITPQWATYLEQIRQPLVVLGSNPFPERFNTVTYDWKQAGLLLTEHFIEQGHQKIGLLNGEIDYFPAQRLYEGYREALAKHGLVYDEKRVAWPPRTEHYAVLEKFMPSLDVQAMIVEAGALYHLFNWAWNNPQKRMPVIGVLDGLSQRSVNPGNGKHIVRVQFDDLLLNAAIESFFRLLAGDDQLVHHVLKPALVLP